MILGYYKPKHFQFAVLYRIDSHLNALEFVDLNQRNQENLTDELNSSQNSEIQSILTEFLDRYFEGSIFSNEQFVDRLQIFENPDFKNKEFSQKLLKYVAKIPFGTIESYSNIADNIGTKAIRATGTVLAHNQYPILIPCHRVVPKKFVSFINMVEDTQDSSKISAKHVGGFMGESNSDSWPILIKTQLLQFELESVKKNNKNVL